MKRKLIAKNTVFDRMRPLTVILCSSLFLLLFSLFTSLFTNNWVFLPVGLSALLLEIAFFWMSGTLKDKKYRGNEKLSILNSMTLDFFMEQLTPIVILDEHGEILWNNKVFQEASKSQNALYRQNINSVTDEKIALRRLRDDNTAAQKEKPILALLAGEEYQVVSYKIASDGRTCLVTLWESRKEVNDLREELLTKNPIAAHIAVDNYSEAAGFLQGSYRTIAAQISVLLKEWAGEINGVLQEVGNDRYVLWFEEQYLSLMTEKKFEILDLVREISKDNIEIPVTISIGVAVVDGTLQAKERAARQALDLALQRGGDQAVLKLRDNATEYYGGKSKTVQKRTKIRSRIIATEVKNLILKASNVIVMGHRFADHDSIGSSIGMARFAMQYSSKVNIVVNTRDTNLKGIFRKLSDIEEYKNIFISGTDAQDLITSSTLLIITDVNNVRQFEAPELFENIANIVIIDHHRQSAEFMVKPSVTYIEPSASSASELVCEMLEQQMEPGTLLKEEAELLFAGIILDTKQFANNTGPRTFAAAHYLRSEGANPAEAQMLFRAGLEDFKREIKYEINTFVYRDIIAFSYIEENATQEDKIAAAKAADRLLTLDGILASFVLCRIDQTVHISARSSGTVNVQLITEKLNGGGHFDMAGAQIKDSTIKDTFVRLKEVIDEYLSEA